jgi:HSF-type DNA-binding
MLDKAEKEGYEHIVSWQPHGRAFQVHDQTEFVDKVMPAYFRQTRFSSFQRQLSLYGFLRLTRRGADHGAYYHECFLRGLKPLCYKMQRTRVKGYWVRQSSSPATEPDFYAMPYVNPVSHNTGSMQGLLSMSQSQYASTPVESQTISQYAMNENMYNNNNNNEQQQTFSNTAAASWYTPSSSSGRNMEATMPSAMPIDTPTRSSQNWYMPPNINKRQRSMPALSPISVNNSNQVDPYYASYRNPLSESTQAMSYNNNNPVSAAYFSSSERHDLASFLFDVDLESDDEDNYGYRNEVEFGRISRQEFANE